MPETFKLIADRMGDAVRMAVNELLQASKSGVIQNVTANVRFDDKHNAVLCKANAKISFWYDDSNQPPHKD